MIILPEWPYIYAIFKLFPLKTSEALQSLSDDFVSIKNMDDVTFKQCLLLFLQDVFSP